MMIAHISQSTHMERYVQSAVVKEDSWMVSRVDVLLVSIVSQVEVLLVALVSQVEVLLVSQVTSPPSPS